MSNNEPAEEDFAHLDEFMQMAGGTSSMKTMYDSYIGAGFTENQALKLLAFQLWAWTGAVSLPEGS